ncbi:MAG: M14 family metallocarboxypeptidase [Piscinibacter sp.]|nr:M14 family metallocarboxypeptidase [Piscinibacter sp.]MBP6025834.1 M14 family metallocarboxypeptidase [Piscinibacter sp.]
MHRTPIVVLFAALLGACATVAPPRAPQPAPPRPAAVAVSLPTPQPSVPASAPAAAAPGGPYGSAVMARFPDPAVRYATPAFTSNAELQAQLRELVREAKAAGSRAQLLVAGVSQTGQPIEALLLSRQADLEPAALRASGRTTVLLIGQQHGDEPAGAEALLALAHSLAQGSLAPRLDGLNVIVLPRANPDGAQAGRRATASGIDLNRDHVLLRTPEAQAIAGLMRDYAPAVVVDAHEYPAVAPYLDKFGGVARADALLQYAMAPNVHEFVSRAAEEWFRRPLLERLQREGLTSDWYHTLATAPDDRRVAMGAPRPDLGRNAAGLRHAVSLLVETRGSELGRTHFARRVHTQVVAMESVLASAAARADDLAKLRRFVETETVAQACSGETVVEAASTPSEYLLKLIDPASGADMPVNVAWDSALQLQTLRARARPCGYWLAAGERDAALRLRGLGLTVQRIEEQGVVRGESYRETSRAAVADSPGALQPQVETVPALLDVAPGSWYVPLDQPLAGLAIAALEPDTPVSYVTQGVIAGGVHAVSRVLARPGFRLGTLP